MIAGNQPEATVRQRTMRKSIAALAVVVVTTAGAGCASDSRSSAAPTSTGVPTTTVAAATDPKVFGDSKGPCQATVLTNGPEDDAVLAKGADCFVGAVGSGTPVVWDVRTVTDEGDSIPVRYAYDGKVVTITIDTTHDAIGTPGVSTQTCAGVEPRALSLPTGVGCTTEAGTGFDWDSVP